MRTAKIKLIEGGARAVVEVSDPTQQAEFESEFEAADFLKRAGWQLLSSQGGVWGQAKIPYRSYAAVPLPDPPSLVQRCAVRGVTSLLEVWVFRTPMVESLVTQYGFRFGLSGAVFLHGLPSVSDPVLSLFVPPPITVEALGYWPHVDDCVVAAHGLLERLEERYGQQLFQAALSQNIHRIISAP